MCYVLILSSLSKAKKLFFLAWKGERGCVLLCFLPPVPEKEILDIIAHGSIIQVFIVVPTLTLTKFLQILTWGYGLWCSLQPSPTMFPLAPSTRETIHATSKSFRIASISVCSAPDGQRAHRGLGVGLPRAQDGIGLHLGVSLG